MWSMTYGARHRVEQVGVAGEVLGVEVQHDVPAERLRRGATIRQNSSSSGAPPRWATKLNRVPRTPASCSVAMSDDVNDSSIIATPAYRPWPRRERVDHRRVVGAVAARLHEHGARQPEPVLQVLERRRCRSRAACRCGRREYGNRDAGPKMWQWASHAPGGGVNARGGCGAGCGAGMVRSSMESQFLRRSGRVVAGTRCRPSACGPCARCPHGARSTVPSSCTVASIAAVNTPVGCSHDDERACRRPRRTTDAAGESGSRAAVATDTAAEHADRVVAAVGDERAGVDVAVADAGGDTSVILGTLAPR